MKEYGIYTELGQFELVGIVKADTYEEAKEKAKKLGYGKEYRIEELEGM